MRPLSLLLAPEVTPRARMRLVRFAGDYLRELGLLCLADSLATAGPEKDPGAEEDLIRLWDQLLLTEEVLDSQGQEPLLRGNDLIQELNLKPGPLIGRLLAGIEEARLAGEINDRAEALKWAREMIDR
jgi:hypothetical protein